MSEILFQLWSPFFGGKVALPEHGDAIKVFYLPSYSLELNPDKMTNADLKQAVTKISLGI